MSTITVILLDILLTAITFLVLEFLTAYRQLPPPAPPTGHADTSHVSRTSPRTRITPSVAAGTSTAHTTAQARTAVIKRRRDNDAISKQMLRGVHNSPSEKSLPPLPAGAAPLPVRTARSRQRVATVTDAILTAEDSAPVKRGNTIAVQLRDRVPARARASPREDKFEMISAWQQEVVAATE